VYKQSRQDTGLDFQTRKLYYFLTPTATCGEKEEAYGVVWRGGHSYCWEEKGLMEMDGDGLLCCVGLIGLVG